MQKVELTKRRFATAELSAEKQRACTALASDCRMLLDEPAVLFIDGQPGGLYMPVPPEELAGARAAVERIDYQETYRTGGLKTRSRVVGFQPRVTVRRDYCTTAAMSHDMPKEHALICAGAALASRYFKEYLPEAFAAHEKVVQAQVKPGWMLPGSAYTSGIVNWDNRLNYHCDSGNFPGTWNAMLTFKKDLEGGHLAIPELDVTLAVRDATLSIFNAQALMHGVTPFRKTSPRGYRYTIVYYALSGMCHCGTPAEELERIRAVKTQRELKRRAP